MPTTEEIDAALRQDQDFLKLQQSDPEMAIRYAEEAFKMAEAEPTASSGAGPVRTYIRPLLEGAGAVGGGVIGAGGGPIGVAAGGLLGAAGGSALADVAEQFAGEQVPPQTLAEAGSKTIQNLETGAMSEVGGQALNFAVKGGQKLLKPFSHLIDESKERILRLAEEMGVKLSPGDITGSKPLSMFVEGIGERTPFSAGQIHDFRMEGIKKLVDRRNELLEKGGTPEALEETGQRIQARAQELMDELGVTNQNMKKVLMDSTLERLGSTESFEMLGLSGQEAMMTKLAQRSAGVKELYDEAFSLFPAGERVQPDNLNAAARRLEGTMQDIDPALVDPKLLAFIRQFKGSGNRAYDEQQAFLKEQLANVPERLRGKATEVLLEGKPLEKPGFDPHQLNQLRSRLNTAIDEMDAGLKLSGQTGVKGVGTSKQNIDRKALLDLKTALDADIEALSTKQGGELQGAFDVARLASGNLKTIANSKAVKSFLQARPQEAARMLAQSRDLQGIRTLKNVMGPQFKNVEDAFANDLLGVGREGLIGPAFLRGQLNKYQKGVPTAILGPGKVNQIRALANQLESLDSAAIENPFFKRLLKISPEKVVDYIVKPGNTNNIKFVRDRLGAEAVQDVARGMANKILRKPTFDVPEEEFIISPNKLLTGLKKLGDDTLKELFKHDPTFLKEIRELSEVAMASQGAARAAANPSGTGQSLIAFGELSMILMSPKTGIAMTVGIPAATKLYLSPVGRQWLTRGFQTSPTSPQAGAIIGKLLGIAAADNVQFEQQGTSARPEIPTSSLRQQPSLPSLSMVQ